VKEYAEPQQWGNRKGLERSHKGAFNRGWPNNDNKINKKGEKEKEAHCQRRDTHMRKAVIMTPVRPLPALQ